MTRNNNKKSNKNTGNFHPYRANLRPVSQFDLEGNLIREYRSIAEAASVNEISSSNIIAVVPLVGTWIEMIILTAHARTQAVVPLVGTWIEISWYICIWS